MTIRTSNPAASEKCVAAEIFAFVRPEAEMHALADSASSLAHASDVDAWAPEAQAKHDKAKTREMFLGCQLTSIPFSSEMMIQKHYLHLKPGAILQCGLFGRG